MSWSGVKANNQARCVSLFEFRYYWNLNMYYRWTIRPPGMKGQRKLYWWLAAERRSSEYFAVATCKKWKEKRSEHNQKEESLERGQPIPALFFRFISFARSKLDWISTFSKFCVRLGAVTLTSCLFDQGIVVPSTVGIPASRRDASNNKFSQIFGYTIQTHVAPGASRLVGSEAGQRSITSVLTATL